MQGGVVKETKRFLLKKGFYSQYMVGRLVVVVEEVVVVVYCWRGGVR